MASKYTKLDKKLQMLIDDSLQRQNTFNNGLLRSKYGN